MGGSPQWKGTLGRSQSPMAHVSLQGLSQTPASPSWMPQPPASITVAAPTAGSSTAAIVVPSATTTTPNTAAAAAARISGSLKEDVDMDGLVQRRKLSTHAKQNEH